MRHAWFISYVTEKPFKYGNITIDGAGDAELLPYEAIMTAKEQIKAIFKAESVVILSITEIHPKSEVEVEIVGVEYQEPVE